MAIIGAMGKQTTNKERKLHSLPPLRPTRAVDDGEAPGARLRVGARVRGAGPAEHVAGPPALCAERAGPGPGGQRAPSAAARSPGGREVAGQVGARADVARRRRHARGGRRHRPP